MDGTLKLPFPYEEGWKTLKQSDAILVNAHSWTTILTNLHGCSFCPPHENISLNETQ